MQRTPMASSSSYSLNNDEEDHRIKQNYPEEEDQQEREWLGLGLGVTRPSSTRSHPGLRLGLGLGFVDEGFGKESSRSRRSTGSVDHHGFWHPSSHHLHRDHHVSASPSWPWRMQAHDHRHHDQRNLLLLASPSHHHNDYYSRPRPETGFWFSLRAFFNREVEALPQVPKAYIRVKNGDVTVFMVKKYLVGKLGLASEAEIDILCMGQNLIHSQTLKDVSDAVWLPRLFHSPDVIASLDENVLGTTANLLMPLHYRKHCYRIE